MKKQQKTTVRTPMGQFTINVYHDHGQQMIYLSDDSHGDVTLPVPILSQLMQAVHIA